MMMVGARKSLTAVCALLVLSGCYTYTPIDASVAPPGEEIRVYVTRAGQTELAEIVGDNGVAGAAITGVVQGLEDDDLLMRVAVGQRQEGFRVIDMLQTIRVPRGEIISMERREVNKVGTGLVLAGGVALGIGVVLGIMEAFGTGEPENGEPPVEDFTWTFGRFSFPWGR
jgi:hypothetical protein